MKFDDLYNRVFVQEQAPSDANTEVANPENFDDVDPIPLPEPGVKPVAAAGAPQISSSLTDYMTQCNEFADKLQSSGDCLQTLVASLDKPLTPFEGISGTSSDIERVAALLRQLAGRILSYNIAAAKK
jgi:hypothetical protein